MPEKRARVQRSMKSTKFIVVNLPRSLADVVGVFQQKAPGFNFCSIKYQVKRAGNHYQLACFEGAYLPLATVENHIEDFAFQLEMEQFTNQTSAVTIPLLTFPKFSLPLRLEHLLHLYRLTYPGINFHDLRLSANPAGLIIEPT